MFYLDSANRLFIRDLKPNNILMDLEGARATSYRKASNMIM